MKALGFPADAVRVVADLLVGATTVVHTQSGKTSEIPVRRGTIQEESLSPATVCHTFGAIALLVARQ